MVVNDGGIDSPADQVVITVKDFNNMPIANAGLDKSECEGMIASLDGSASIDQYGKSLTFQWKAPDGIVLSSTTSSNPTFVAPQVSANTNFIFSLVVNNGNDDSPSDEVLISVLKCSNQRQQDSLALVSLYKATDGPNWTKKNNWLTGSLNTWEGVILENGRVVYLYPQFAGLKGQLPSELSSLSEIRMMNFFVNQLTGPLPNSWSNLVKLESLYLELNQLTGPLPESWSALVNLKELSLGSNQLSGLFPASWTSLVNLQTLNLYGNKLTGLPDLTSLTNLDRFVVFGNMLDFGDIEPNIGVPKSNFYYSPQASVGKNDTIIKTKGQEFRIFVTVGGKNNKYQWNKNGTIIQNATGNEFFIPGVTQGDAGIYTCQITNTVATELTLQSQPITLQVQNLVDEKVVQSSDLKVYSISSNGIYKIDGLPTNTKNEIAVYTMDGKLIKKQNSVLKIETIDISDQASGSYLIIINKQLFKIEKSN